MELSSRSASSGSPRVDVDMAGASQQDTVVLIPEPSQDDEDDLKLDGPFKSFFEQGLPVNVFVVVSVILTSLYNHKGAGILSWSFSGISMVCLFASFIVHLTAMAFTQEVTVRCWLAYFSVILRIVAGTFLLLLLDTVPHLVVILPLTLVVIVLLGCFLVEQVKDANQDKRLVAGRYWKEYEEDLKIGFDVSSQVVTFAFAGMLGAVLSYVKDSSSNQLLLSGRGYMAPDCFLLYSLVLGLLVQLLSTVTPYIYMINTRKRAAKVYLRIVTNASLMFLALASVIAAEEILQKWVWVLISCFIIIIIPVLCFWLEKRNGLVSWGYKKILPTNIREGLDDDKAAQDKAAQIMLTLLTSSFAALMASNSKYSIKTGTAVSLSGWFKSSVLLELYGVLSCVVQMVVSFEKRSWDKIAKMVWNLSAIATIIITVILLAVLARLHPEEIKNIF